MATKRILMPAFLSQMIFFASVAAIGCNAAGNNSAVTTNDSLIQRIVCFKFKPTATPGQVEQHMNGFSGLADSISYIVSYRAGKTVQGDLDEKPEYDVMHYSIYRSEEDIRKYSVHPVHLRFIEQNKDIWDKVLVINSKIANVKSK